MKKNIFLFIACVSFATIAVAQDRTIKTSETIYTSLKPADGNPAVFSSQEELNAKVEMKKNNVKALIKENSADTAQVRLLREQLWRFENAIVKKPNPNK